jgi:cytochrome b involved in lipid metabolism
MSQQISQKDVAAHNKPENGLWIIIDNEVYDVTKFVDEHPGGPKILKRSAGKDATKPFWKVCAHDVLICRCMNEILTYNLIVSRRPGAQEVRPEAQDRHTEGGC